MAKKQLTIDPNGDLFDAAEVCAAKLVDSGVILQGERGRFLHVIKEADKDKAKQIRDEIVLLVMAISEGRAYRPQWPSAKISSPVK